MKPLPFKLLLAVPFFWCLAALATPAPPAFEAAARAYEKGDFATARDLYQQLARQPASSTNALFNLGNAEYRLGEPGRAVLAYERALLLEPDHPEAKANLAVVRRQAGAKTLAEPWVQAAIFRWPVKVYGALGVLAFWLGIFSLAGWLFSRRRRGLVALGIGCAVILGALTGAWLWVEVQRFHQAVVIVPEAQAHLEAADRSSLAETLPAGSNVQILSERGAWTYCELPGGGRGWLASASIERLVPVLAFPGARL